MAYTRRVFPDLVKDHTPVDNLREASKAYLYSSLESYLNIEAKGTSVHTYGFAHSANAICSLCRAIEHLLKLKLLKIDPMLIYPMPKEIKDYYYLKQIKTKDDPKKIRDVKENFAVSHTIEYKEALKRLELMDLGHDFNFEPFRDIYNLRNRLEHHWDNSNEFLVKIIMQFSNKYLVGISDFIANILGEAPNSIIDSAQLEKVQILDRALKNGFSMRLQEKAEIHKDAWEKYPDKFQGPFKVSPYLVGHERYETGSTCPVCNDYLIALFTIEADWDNVDGESVLCGGYTSVDLLYCESCHFSVEDSEDIQQLLPEGIEFDNDEDIDYS